jgi:hypothetical protein
LKKNWFIKGNEIYQGVDAYEIRPIIMHRIHHFTGSFVVCANLLRNSTITNCNSTAHIALLKPATKTTSKNMLQKPSPQKSKGSGNKQIILWKQKGLITKGCTNVTKDFKRASIRRMPQLSTVRKSLESLCKPEGQQ